MIWTLLLFISQAFSQDMAVERYCFSSPLKMQQIHSKLKMILVPADKAEQDGSCLVINSPAHRRELLQNYVRNLDPSVAISFSSAESRRDPCLLKIEKTKQTERQDTNLGVDGNLQFESTTLQKEMSDTTSIQTLKDFELTVDQDVVKGECRFITPTRYEITLEVRHDPKPLIPGLPKGSHVIIQNPPAPQDQETGKLRTTLQLNQGNRIEIGSTVKDLREKNQNGSVNPAEIGIKNTSGQSVEKVFLSLE